MCYNLFSLELLPMYICVFSIQLIYILMNKLSYLTRIALIGVQPGECVRGINYLY